MEEEKQVKAKEETEKNATKTEFKWEVGVRLDPDYPMDWGLRW